MVEEDPNPVIGSLSAFAVPTHCSDNGENLQIVAPLYKLGIERVQTYTR